MQGRNRVLLGTLGVVTVGLLGVMYGTGFSRPGRSPRAAVQPLRSLQQLVMVNSRVGWALTDYHIVRTTDGGRRWTIMGPAISYNISTLTDVTAIHVAVAVSAPTRAPQSPYVTRLWVTADGGAAWHHTLIPWSNYEPIQTLQMFPSGARLGPDGR